MNWRPIETAPRDGTLILMIKDGNHMIGYWLNDPPMWIEWCVGQVNPTHWMPLPPPPVVKESLTPATDNDLDEPLGKACSMDNPECESCS
jgi:hypothetical protein